MNRRDWGIVAAIAGFGAALTWQGARVLARSRGGSRRDGGEAEDSREPAQVTAAEMAREAGISPNVFRAALRAAELPWHGLNEPWTAVRDSAEHRDMIRVLEELRRDRGG